MRSIITLSLDNDKTTTFIIPFIAYVYTYKNDWLGDKKPWAIKLTTSYNSDYYMHFSAEDQCLDKYDEIISAIEDYYNAKYDK
jgi:hypothetical protein